MKNDGAGRGIRIIFCLISCMNIFILVKRLEMQVMILFHYLFIYLFFLEWGATRYI